MEFHSRGTEIEIEKLNNASLENDCNGDYEN